MAIRHTVLIGSAVVLVALLVSSPKHWGFWVVLGAAAFVLVAYVGPLTQLYRDSPRGSARR